MLTGEQSVEVLINRAALHVATGVYIQDAILSTAVELWQAGQADGLLMWLYQLGNVDKMLLMRRVKNAAVVFVGEMTNDNQ